MKIFRTVLDGGEEDLARVRKSDWSYDALRSKEEVSYVLKLEGLRLLVTGGAGFIGSHLVDALLSMNNQVVVYDNFDEYYLGKEKNIRHNLKKPSFTLIRADILDYETLLRSLKGIDIVFHLAAQSGVRFSVKNPEKTTRVNVFGTLNVLKAAKEANIKKVIVASSSSVYGQPKYVPVDEKHPLEPISIYGASKLAVEKYCQIFNDQLSRPVLILRYHTVYGPRQRPDMAIHKWTKAIFKGKPITIYGDGKQTRDFTFIGDIVDGTIKVAETENVHGEIFNLGGGTRLSINNVVKLLIGTSEVDNVQVIYEPPKLGEVSDTHADITKARKMIGFNPKVKLKEGVKCFIEWYKKYKLGK